MVSIAAEIAPNGARLANGAISPRPQAQGFRMAEIIPERRGSKSFVDPFGGRGGDGRKEGGIVVFHRTIVVEGTEAPTGFLLRPSAGFQATHFGTPGRAGLKASRRERIHFLSNEIESASSHGGERLPGLERRFHPVAPSGDSLLPNKREAVRENKPNRIAKSLQASVGCVRSRIDASKPWRGLDVPQPAAHSSRGGERVAGAKAEAKTLGLLAARSGREGRATGGLHIGRGWMEFRRIFANVASYLVRWRFAGGGFAFGKGSR